MDARRKRRLVHAIPWLIPVSVMGVVAVIALTGPDGPLAPERLNDADTERLVWTYATIGLRADNGACTALRRPPDRHERAAVALIVRELRRRPGAKLVSPSQPTGLVRQFARGEADRFAGCFARVPARAPGWATLERQLDSALAAASQPQPPIEDARGAGSSGRRGPGSGRFGLEGRGDVDRGHQGAGDGAVLGVRAQASLGAGELRLDVVELEVVRHVDPAQDEDLVLQLDLALGDSDESVTG